jgi:hypothetical protein
VKTKEWKECEKFRWKNFWKKMWKKLALKKRGGSEKRGKMSVWKKA